MLSRSSAVPAPGVPSATDVRAARTIAVSLANSASSEVPVPVFVARDDMEGAARVLSDGLPRLRVAPALTDDALIVRGAFHLADVTWLNGTLRIVESPSRGYPDISAQIGAVPLPTWILGPLLVVAHKAAEWRAQTRFPTLSEAIIAFDAVPGRIEAVIDLPRGLLRGVSKLAPSNDGVDAAKADRLYTRVMERFNPRVPIDLAEVYAVAFEDAPDSNDASRVHARAAMIAVAMSTIGPHVRRLAGGGNDDSFRPQLPATLKVVLSGRDDLAKHFALSAALAATANPELGRALGTWKELDDSLAGGSGFSFVDLTADRAGLRLGQASTDAYRARRIVSAMNGSMRPELLPLAALGFDEGLSDSEFRSRYGNIASDDYDSTVARIDRALDSLPIMRR